MYHLSEVVQCCIWKRNQEYNITTMFKTNRILVSVFILLTPLTSLLAVELPAVFNDHMVIQRESRVPVWGWAPEGKKITVEFNGQMKAAIAGSEGKWTVFLDPMKSSSIPQDMTITESDDPTGLPARGSSSVKLHDILIGEVWLASGQSNMEFQMKNSFKSTADIATSANPMIRHFNFATGSIWQVANPENTPGFSAVAYYFSRDLQKALQIPVGIVHASLGGSPVEAWMSIEFLAANPVYKHDVLDRYLEQQRSLDELMAQWEQEKAVAQKDGKPFTMEQPWQPWEPADLYDRMISHLIPFAMRGAIWYQGESNVARAWEYRNLYPDMIRNWRNDWGIGDFTFLGVQLAPFDHYRIHLPGETNDTPGESACAELREAQVLSTKVVSNCGLAVITDVGDKDDVHPSRKEPVGSRLALLARNIAYGEDILACGPSFKSMEVRDGSVILSFDNTGSGLEARGGELTGFSICGEDRKFVWAKAEIRENKVVLSSSQVSKPVTVRFGWADYPVVNLFNREGLPASPFRTDDFPMLTAPKEKTERTGGSAVIDSTVQAGFYTPGRTGQLWDTWVYHFNGKYYMYYLAGPHSHWDGIELATSEDGVHWKEYGMVVKPRSGVTWVGTGQIWKSPDFEKNHKWIMNYSEWLGDKQDITFATSTDLLNWTKADEKYRFVQDARWYREKGRWDCIDVLRLNDGTFFGYFTADVDEAKLSYQPCNFGFAESKDGISWTALPPIKGDIQGEVCGIEKIRSKYYLMVGLGRVYVSDNPKGPFTPQKKNFNAFGVEKETDSCFPRFFHNAPGAPLVSNHFQRTIFYAAPLKAIDIDREGIMRLKWWKGNESIKTTLLKADLTEPGRGYTTSLRMLETKLDRHHTYVIEGTLVEKPGEGSAMKNYGIFFDRYIGTGQCLLLGSDGSRHGEFGPDPAKRNVYYKISRDINLGLTLNFRLVIKDDMVELYINDYLFNTKRILFNGQIGFIGADDKGAFKNIRVWQSN